MAAKQLLQNDAGEINEWVRRAAVCHDDAAAAVLPPTFEDSFSQAPPRAIAVAPLTGISREHSSEQVARGGVWHEHSSDGPAGSCWVCCEGGPRPRT